MNNKNKNSYSSSSLLKGEKVNCEAREVTLGCYRGFCSMGIIRASPAFTLIEIMLGVLIVSIVIIGGFQALTAVSIGKVRLIQKTDLQKESLYFTQRLFEMIKKGGTIDYEEYFNRKVIGNTTYLSGHFDKDSGFGNFGVNGILGPVGLDYGDKFYYCRSGDGIGNQMTGSGCYNNDLNTEGVSVIGNQQRYGQYSLQFIDYNSNYDADNGTLGDEDGDGEFRGDDDDEYLGDGPEVFTGGVDLTELYLLSGNKKERTLFRWNVELDPDAPVSAICDTNNTVTGTGCLGTIEYLKLQGIDRGMNHLSAGVDSTRSDGLIDTWLIDPTFIGGAEEVAGIDDINRVRLFPKTINVSEFKVYAYPNKNMGFSWKNDDPAVNISPYVILKFKLKPSWISRKQIKGDGQELDFSMTINLSEIYSK